METTASPASTGNVQEIMEGIRQRIAEKKSTGEYSPEELERIDRYVLQIETEGYNTPEEDLRHHLSVLNYLFDTLKPPEFSSHRRRFGAVVTGIKKTIRRITEPFIQMTLKRQVEFNAETVRLLNQLVSDYRFRVSALEQQLAGRPAEVLAQEKRWEDLSRQVSDLSREMRAQKNAVEDLLARLGSAASRSAPGPALPADAEARVRAFEYLRFENRHRGPEDVIRDRQRLYLSYFRQSGKVLDLGCGRGEFLALLKEAGLAAVGVELNPEMAAQAREKGLEVFEGDGLEFLKNSPDQSWGGIFLSQVIEHLEAETLRDLVRTAFHKLIPGGVLLAETINPQCLTTFSGAFYLDLSHHNPIHPEAARFLWESLGFTPVEILFVSPYPEEMRLEEAVRRDDETYEDEIARVLNKNIQRLNALLYGYQDYAVVGYK